MDTENNNVLNNKDKPIKYRSRNYTLLLTFIIGALILVAILSLLVFDANPNYKYVVPFYSDINEVNFNEYETNLRKIVKPTDGYIVLNGPIKIVTDKDGIIKEVSMDFIINKKGKYFSFYSVFDEENKKIKINQGLTVYSNNLIQERTYASLNDYAQAFSQISFNNLWDFVEIDEYSLLDLGFNFRVRNTYDPANFDDVKVIDSNGNIVLFPSYMEGIIGSLAVEQIRNYLNGSSSSVIIDSLILMPKEN